MDEGTLFVLGNLLLDMICPVDEAYLEQHNLQPDSIQRAEQKHSVIYEDILRRPDVTLSPGGSALNTVRMVQRILNVPKAVTLIGAVGMDDRGKLLTDRLEEEGIKLYVQLIEGSSTGHCASLLTSGGLARTMITDLGAALKFSHDRFISDKNVLERLDMAKFVYISGYFLKVSQETVMEVVTRAKSKNVPIVVNLNAVWITDSCKEELLNLLPYTDILFGNEPEVLSFAKQLGLLTLSPNETNQNISSIATQLSTIKLQEHMGKDAKSGMTVIVTRGENPVILVENGIMTEYPVQTVAKAEIVDSTGAGDAFVGGFLAYYVQGKGMHECIGCGIWAATEELKGRGFILPTTNTILNRP